MEPFIDNHCHSFFKDFEERADELARRCFTESRSLDDVQHQIAYHHAKLRAGEMNIAAMVVDDGYASDRMLSLPELQKKLGDSTRVFRCKRIEPVIEKHLAEATTVPELQEAVFNDLFGDDEDEIHKVALKTIMAYRGGLTLDTVPVDQAAHDFQNARHEFHAGRHRIHRRPIYHYLLRQIFEAAGARQLPVQIHCGLGDDDALLIESNPALFQPVLKQQTLQSTRFVFLHCFPYVREAAILAGLYPNVYFDLSLAIPVVSPLARDLIAEALSIAPTNKLLAGTDGHSHPIMHSYGAMIWRSALTEALDTLKARGFLDGTACATIERRVLNQNAQELYRLGMRF